MKSSAHRDGEMDIPGGGTVGAKAWVLQKMR